MAVQAVTCFLYWPKDTDINFTFQTTSTLSAGMSVHFNKLLDRERFTFISQTFLTHLLFKVGIPHITTTQYYAWVNSIYSGGTSKLEPWYKLSNKNQILFNIYAFFSFKSLSPHPKASPTLCILYPGSQIFCPSTQILMIQMDDSSLVSHTCLQSVPSSTFVFNGSPHD